jgi:hypothetical protein
MLEERSAAQTAEKRYGADLGLAKHKGSFVCENKLL